MDCRRPTHHHPLDLPSSSTFRWAREGLLQEEEEGVLSNFFLPLRVTSSFSLPLSTVCSQTRSGDRKKRKGLPSNDAHSRIFPFDPSFQRGRGHWRETTTQKLCHPLTSNPPTDRPCTAEEDASSNFSEGEFPSLSPFGSKPGARYRRTDLLRAADEDFAEGKLASPGK